MKKIFQHLTSTQVRQEFVRVNKQTLGTYNINTTHLWMCNVFMMILSFGACTVNEVEGMAVGERSVDVNSERVSLSDQADVVGESAPTAPIESSVDPVLV